MYSRLHEWIKFKVGDRLTLRFTNGTVRTATISGFTAPHNSGILNLGNFRNSHAISNPQFIPRTENPLPGYFILQIPPDQISTILNRLSSLNGVFMVTTDQFAAYAEGLIDRFSSLPLVVAGISLFASGTIIANSVTLITIERRRSMGILKAVGLQGWQVLGLLMIENGVIGSLGSVSGIVLSTAIIEGGGFLGEGNNLPVPQIIGLILLPLFLTLIITVLAAYRATQEKPIEALRLE
jgi:ABC-type antimicrobial peptide transport system permease subunit